MTKRYFLFLALLMHSFFSMNCATVFKGYESSVRLIDAPDSLRVITHDGVEIPVENKTIRVKAPVDGNVYIDKEAKVLRLRNNKEYTLHLKYQSSEKVLTIYPKIGFGWAVLDFVCGVIPSFYDAYTGNWNSFSDIDAKFNSSAN
jgi:hypothetical protein